MGTGGGPNEFSPLTSAMAKRNIGSLWKRGSWPDALSGGLFLMPQQNSVTACGLVIQFRNSQASLLCLQATGITKTLPPAVVVLGRPSGGAGSGHQPSSSF